MELPDTSNWIDNSLLPDQDQHALYATDLPPLNQSQDQSGLLYDHTLQQALSFEVQQLPPPPPPPRVEFHHCQELQQHQHPFPQPEQPGPRAAASDHAGCMATAKRVNKADREKLRRDKLNEQFTELASALDPDRPKNDKATILSDSVQELNELRAEVKRLKAEQAALLDESRDLTQEKSELREEKALLKTETDQLNSQLQQRLRLALSWTMDPSLMMGAAPYPYPVPIPAPSPAEATPAPTPAPAASANASSAPSPASVSSQNILPPVLPPPPFAMPLPPFAMHPYAMFAGSRPPGSGSLPFFPYFAPPAMVGSTNPGLERPFPHYPMHMLRGYGGQDAAAAPLFQPEASYKPVFGAAPLASKARDESSEQVTDSQQQAPDSEDSNPSQIEGSPASAASEVKQEVTQQTQQSFVKTLSPIREGSSSPSISPAAA